MFLAWIIFFFVLLFTALMNLLTDTNACSSRYIIVLFPFRLLDARCLEDILLLCLFYLLFSQIYRCLQICRNFISLLSPYLIILLAAIQKMLKGYFLYRCTLGQVLILVVSHKMLANHFICRTILICFQHLPPSAKCLRSILFTC